MKKILLAPPIFLLWIFYFIITLEARDRYLVGTSKGMHCYKSEDASKFIYGSVTEYSFSRNMKPQREYATWREFWTRFGYYKEDASLTNNT